LKAKVDITINMLGIYLRKERPNELAATILYLACRETGENKTQNELANAVGVTEVAVRSGIRHLVKSLNLPAVRMI
jgi:transcription initiation factor TFIIIB Brf1 subunit/transcription initiation factor TFIIB